MLIFPSYKQNFGHLDFIIVVVSCPKLYHSNVIKPQTKHLQQKMCLLCHCLIFLFFLYRSPTAIFMIQCCCWPIPSTESWKIGSGTAWPVWAASGRTPNRGREARVCWILSKRYENAEENTHTFLLFSLQFYINVVNCSEICKHTVCTGTFEHTYTYAVTKSKNHTSWVLDNFFAMYQCKYRTWAVVKSIYVWMHMVTHFHALQVCRVILNVISNTQ